MTAGPPPPPSVPPSGWYPDGTGSLRWWDGASWTESAVSLHSDRPWAAISHISLFAFAVIAPLLILLTFGRRDPFVKHHASEALNAQIWFFILWNALIGSFVVVALTVAGTQGPPVWMLALFPLAIAAYAVVGGFAIWATVQASRGVWWRYPLPFRFVKGSVKA